MRDAATEPSVVKDFSREGMTWHKFLQLFRLLWRKNTKTLAHLKLFSELDPEKIHKETGVKIKGIILDVDGTISHNHGKILPENIRHIELLLAQGIKIVCYSNMLWTERYSSLPKAVKVLSNLPAKPHPQGFKQACTVLGCDKKNIVMIGDSYITDGGAIRYGIHFIHVKPIKDKNKNFKEFVQNAVRDFYNGLARRRHQQ